MILAQEVLLIFLCFLYSTTGERKDNSISLTWNVTTTTLNLICKIENLKWQVEIFDPSGVEQGFCVPHPLPECHKNFPNDTTLNQNITTNLTIFTRSISNSTNFNGLWSCNHGTNADKALTNVIIDKQGENDRKDYCECCSLCHKMKSTLNDSYLEGVDDQNSDKNRDNLTMEYVTSAAILFGIALLGTLIICFVRWKSIKCSEEDRAYFTKCGTWCQKILKFIFNLSILVQSAFVIYAVPFIAEINDNSVIIRMLPLFGVILGVVDGYVLYMLYADLRAASESSPQGKAEENIEMTPLNGNVKKDTNDVHRELQP